MSEVDYDQTVPRELVHRTAVSEVLLTGLAAPQDESIDGPYAIGAQLPRSHAYFGDHPGSEGRFDPILVMEAARQAAIAVSHQFLGAPLEAAFLVRTFNGVASRGPAWEIGSAPGELDIEARVTESFLHEGKRTGVLMELTLRRDGQTMMVVDGSFSWMPAKVWQAIRTTTRTGRGLPEEVAAPVCVTDAAPELVGRRDPRNVVLGAPTITGLAASAELDVDLTHPTLYDHTLDHAPGNLLIEAARQLVTAWALSRGEGVRIDRVESVFAGFSELDVIAQCRATMTVHADGYVAECVVVQDGIELAQIRFECVAQANEMRLGLAQTLTSTRAFRRSLDLTRPVARRDIEECLDLAVYAPTGSNRQNWRFIVLDDQAVIAEVAQFYRRAFADNVGQVQAASAQVTSAQLGELSSAQLGELNSAQYLADHLHEVPVLVLACQLGRPPSTGEPRRLASFYGSVFPAVWSLMLALRSRGIGSLLTTAHLAYERDVARALGIPFDEVSQVALIPVAHLRVGAGGRSRRAPAREVTSWNGWAPT